MAAYDPFYADVVLLLRGNGNNDSQTITDERGHTVTVSGNTCIKTATKKYGTGSIYFDGTGDYLTIAPDDFVFGTDDFTVESWINTSEADSCLVANYSSFTTTTHWGLYITSNGKFGFVNNGVYETSIAIPNNEWVHVAACRASGTLRLYINGSKYHESSNTNSLGVTSLNLTIGKTSVASNEYLGYIDDLRITKAARYTGSTLRVPAFEAPTDNVPPDITLTSITPNKGPTSGGTMVTLAGTGFTDYTTCTIDGNSLTTITTVSDTELTGYTPPGTVGLKDVVVANP